MSCTCCQGQMIGLHHIGVRTTDLTKTHAFYTDVLGFEMFKRVSLPQPNGTATEIAFVRLGTLTLELIQPADLTQVEKETGMVQHVAIAVKGIDGIVEKLKAKGVAFRTEEPVNNEPLNAKLIFFTGAAGETLELFEDL